MSTRSANIYDSLISDEAVPALLTPEGARIDYRELASMSARLANALVAAGLRPGDRLIAVTLKSPRAIALYLATLRAGAVYVPLNPSLTRAEMTYFIGDAEPRIVVSDPRREQDLAEVCAQSDVLLMTLAEAGTGSLDQAAQGEPEHHEVIPRTADDLAAILYTSGTTGRSKGAMLSHGNLLSNATALRSAWEFDERDVLLHALPIFHTHGLFVGINLAFLAKASVLLLPRFDPDAVVRELPRATVLMGVPTYYNRLLATPELTASCGNVRVFISGSAPLPPATYSEWLARTGHQILERYGMTETTMLTSNPLHGDRRPGTVGTALPGVAVRISDAGENGVGMVEVAGPNVFRGYWRMPEKTALEFSDDGFFRTGDLGRFDEAGYLQIVGREKDLVISGGYNVYPKEVETVIDSIDGVVESAVIGVPDADVGERVVAVVVVEENSSVERELLESHVAERLARYKRPREYVFLDALPRNTMGKVQKNVLRRRYTEGDEPRETAVPNERRGALL